MRLVALAVFVVVARVSFAFAQVAAPPPPKVQAEMAALEKVVLDAQRKAAWFAAVKPAKKLYELRQKYYPADDLESLRHAQSYATLLVQSGDVLTARKVNAAILAAIEKKHGPKSRETLNALVQGGSALWSNFDYEVIAPVQQRILALTKELDGESSMQHAMALNQWASVQMGRNEFGAAIRTFEDSLRIQEAIAKPDTDLMPAVYTVAAMAWTTNQRAKAMPLFERVLKLATQKATTDVRYGATMLSSVATMYTSGGREDLAGPVRKRALDLLDAEYTKALKIDPHSPDVGSYAALIGNLYSNLGDTVQAEKWFSIVIAEDKHRGTISGYTGMLADLKRTQGKNDEALALYETAQADLAKLSPGAGDAYALSMVEILIDKKEFARAEKMITTYIASLEKKGYAQALGVTWAKLTGAHVLMAANQPAKAEVMLDAALTASEQELATVLSSGTESDHYVFFARSAFQLDLVLNYARVFGAKRANAHRLALTTLLRRKGRVLDAAAANLATVRKALSPADKQLLDDLASARNQLARLTVIGPSATGEADFAKEVARLEDQIAKLDFEVGKKSAAYRARTQAITLAGVQAQIPNGTKLVELINYGASNPKDSWKRSGGIPPRSYLAYVASRTGDPVLVDLGPAAPIDAAIEKFRVSLADPNDATVTAKGRAVYDLTMAKIAPALGGATDVLLAPDGALNVVPFSALVGADGKFLLEKYTFTYLTSGRDLLRLALRTKARGGGVMFADPAFDNGTKAPAGTTPPTRGRRSSDLAGLVWPPLPGTAAEADGIEKAMKLQVFRRDKATETTLKGVHGPRVLHLATHGFFLPDVPPSDAGPPTGKPAAALPAVNPMNPQVATGAENPLLRSGLVFAGADTLSSGSDDGILTALEATGLDLWGTQLVVMSACETGVGKVTNGDGVFGLRRALVIAGAESLVMSLWEVDDAATRDLMVGYYTRLDKKAARSSALRDVQLELAHKPQYQHPYYWASFVPAGANRPLD